MSGDGDVGLGQQRSSENYQQAAAFAQQITQQWAAKFLKLSEDELDASAQRSATGMDDGGMSGSGGTTYKNAADAWHMAKPLSTSSESREANRMFYKLAAAIAGSDHHVTSDRVVAMDDDPLATLSNMGNAGLGEFDHLTGGTDPATLRDIKAWSANSDPNNPNTIKANAYMTFLSILGNAVSMCQRMQNSIITTESELVTGQQDVQIDNMKKVIQMWKDQGDNIREAAEAAKKQKMYNIFGAIGGMIISIAMSLPEICSGGPVTVVIALVILIASLVVSIVDIFMDGKISKAMAGAINSLAEKVGSKVLAALIIALLIIALIVISKGKAGEALDDVAGQIATIGLKEMASAEAKAAAVEAGKSAIKAALIASFMQFSMMALTAGNVFGTLGLAIAKPMASFFGHPLSEDQEKACEMYCQIIGLIIFSMGVANTYSNVFGKATLVAKARLHALQRKLSTAAQLGGLGTQVFVAIKDVQINLTQARLAAAKGDIDAALEMLQKAIEKLLGISKQDMMDAVNKLMEAVQQAGKTFQGALASEGEMLGELFG